MTGISGLFPGTVGYNNWMSPKSSNMIRVRGIESAKAYPVSANSEIMLFDEDEDVMYLKSTDQSGFPTIRKFTFVEEREEPKSYVTMDEFNRFKEEFYAKQSIRPAKPADDQSAEKQ